METKRERKRDRKANAFMVKATTAHLSISMNNTDGRCVVGHGCNALVALNIDTNSFTTVVNKTATLHTHKHNDLNRQLFLHKQ